MKRFIGILIIAILLCACALGGCKTQTKFVKITFVQDGCPDVVRNIPYGQAATGIPTPQHVKGYTVSWENVDLSCVTTDVTVHAIAMPNTYIITYNLQNKQGATISSVTQKVVFGQSFALLTPSCPTSKFVKWLDETTGQAVENGVWNRDCDITLIAVWADESWSDFH